ncbi:TRAP dicarboxylate transporter- DctP subunit [Nitrosococcus halophilus Nc 4]|uniref:TRAP dicarboxylate transporter-DctP subunit n=1 Tax=Nitrosococcus halophilus (strain Nc4) TaxID=472759 RepID=D5C2W1_NITHN|nr:TRAP transporter substrate-binding protein [Nitrosococcus halophilus]ADE16786.1 TRAP dicarboxylate transporter- DctP subunit [Nitrosococcus halophilus Nc 4]
MVRMMKLVSTFFFFLVLLNLNACGSEPPSTTIEGPSNQIIRWRMVTTWPPGFPVLQEGAERFAKNIEAMSGGRLRIKVFAGGELIPPLETFEAVSQGAVHMGHGSAYYWAGRIPAAQFFSTVPFGMTAKGMNTWLYDGGGLKMWREIYVPFNVVPFPLGNTGVQMGGWFNKKIESAEDLKGLKMRIPGLGGKVFAKAGGNPVLLAGAEVYTALERNTIDATEWIAPFHDQRLGLNRAAQYYYYPGWHEPGTVLELIVNKEAWESLPKDLQAIISVAAQAENLQMSSEMEAKNAQALEELQEQSHTKLLAFPEDVLAKLRRLTQQTLNEQAADDPQFKRVYEAYTAFRQKFDAWEAISEQAYQRTLESENK